MIGRCFGAALALALLVGEARAIVGGAEERGPLAAQSVMVLASGGGVCTAVVVTREALLTAAHCVTGASAYRVHWRGEDEQPVLLEPAAIAVHPQYDPRANREQRRSIDLALVRLKEPLPPRFTTATLTAAMPQKDSSVTVAGHGLAREGEASTMGTVRSAPLNVVEPHGPSRILVWLRGARGVGACQGDSGGPVARAGAVLAIVSWTTGDGGGKCGALTQGILLGPQRAWIDATLQGWGGAARWE